MLEIGQDYIIKEARKYMNFEETPNNSGFKNKKFESMMRKMGWKKYQSWCAYFTELIWRRAYANANIKVDDELKRLFSASAVQTYKNFKSADYQISMKPWYGALVVWQKHKDGKQDWRGHIGIVTKFNGDLFNSIEGNTNDGGSRNGYKVHEHVHQISLESERNYGLRLIGFVHPKFVTYDNIKKTIGYEK